MVAVIKLLLKKLSMDPDAISGYRTVSILPLPVIENAIAILQETRLSHNCIYDPFQSGLRKKLCGIDDISSVD